MDQAAEDSTPAPAWGTLPVEEYLLSKWDLSSPLSIDQQRDRLLKAFMQEDAVGVSSTPALSLQSSEMQELIRTVLVPWRSQQVRRIAEKYVSNCDYLSGELVVLRTYYGGGAADDDKLRGWLEEADPFDETLGGPDDRWWRVLDDATIFDLGEDDWPKVYDVLPELASSRLHRNFTEENVDGVRELVLAKGEEPEEDDFEEAIMSTASVGTCYLLVVDQHAFEEDEFLLVYRDKKGNVVKEATVLPSAVQDFLSHVSRGALTESEYWIDAAVGKKYKTRGEIMRVLLPRVMADSEAV